MHPKELLKTPFWRACLVLPFEYSESEEPAEKHLVERHDECSLTLQFTLAPSEGLEMFNVTEYMVGVCKMVERLLNNFGIEE